MIISSYLLISPISPRVQSTLHISAATFQPSANFNFPALKFHSIVNYVLVVAKSINCCSGSGVHRGAGGIVKVFLISRNMSGRVYCKKGTKQTLNMSNFSHNRRSGHKPGPQYKVITCCRYIAAGVKRWSQEAELATNRRHITSATKSTNHLCSSSICLAQIHKQQCWMWVVLRRVPEISVAELNPQDKQNWDWSLMAIIPGSGHYYNLITAGSDKIILALNICVQICGGCCPATAADWSIPSSGLLSAGCCGRSDPSFVISPVSCTAVLP